MPSYPKLGDMLDGYDYNAPITFDANGWQESGQFPANCIKACSASGSVDNAVGYWRTMLNFAAAIAPHRKLVERYLREFGAWDDLKTANIETLADRVLWIACCEIHEQGEWYGLTH